MYYWKSCCKIELCIGTGSKLYRLLPDKLNLNQTVHFFIHSLPSKVYRFLSASAKQIHIKLHSLNTQSSHDLEQRALLTGESADLDKWANHNAEQTFICSRGPSLLFIRAELRGWLRRLWVGSVAFPHGWLGPGHVWWLIERENPRQRSAGKLWNCQPPFLLRSWVVTDSVGQTDDLTVQCWQLSAKR